MYFTVPTLLTQMIFPEPSKDQPDFLHHTTVRRLSSSPRTVSSDSTLPPPNRIRISVSFVGTQSFFGHGFFDAGVRRHVVLRLLGNGMIRGLGNRRLCMCMERGMVHEHGTCFCIASRTRKSDLWGRLRCPTVVCGWSSVTLGPAFELVT